MAGKAIRFTRTKVAYRKQPLRRDKQRAPGGQRKTGLPRSPVPISLLVFKKRDRPKCEICGKGGTLMCAGCRVTFYCDRDHYQMDMGLHQTICERIRIIRLSPEICCDEESRNRMKKQRKHNLSELCNFTYGQGKLAMESGNFQRAISAATVALRYSKDAFDDKVMVIPIMLVIVESYLYKNDITSAGSYLTQVILIEEQNMSRIQPATTASIRRNEGLVLLARHRLQEARYSFAEEIYQNSKVYGPTHIRTSPGYCYLGEVFRRLGDFDTAAASFAMTVEIWLDWLEPIVQEMKEMSSRKPMPSRDGSAFSKTRQKTSTLLEEGDRLEGLKCLKKVTCCLKLLPVRLRRPIALVETSYAMATINVCSRHYHEAGILIAEGVHRCQSYRLTEHRMYNELIALKKICGRGMRKKSMGNTGEDQKISSTSEDESSTI